MLAEQQIAQTLLATDGNTAFWARVQNKGGFFTCGKPGVSRSFKANLVYRRWEKLSEAHTAGQRKPRSIPANDIDREECLDDFREVTFDSTTVRANSTWPTDSGIVLYSLERAYRNSQLAQHQVRYTKPDAMACSGMVEENPILSFQYQRCFR